MKTKIYIAVRGGLVQGVRCTVNADVFLVDYDNQEDDEGCPIEAEAYERDMLGGKTWDEIEKTSKAVF